MQGLMQEHPLDVGAILLHGERLHSKKTIATRLESGTRVASFAEVGERARRLVSALRALGVKKGDRVATFGWNTQAHVEAYLGIPAAGAILHTLNIRLFEKDLAYIVRHAGDRLVLVDKSLWPQWQKIGVDLPAIVVDDAPGTPLPPGTTDYESLLAAHAPARDLTPVDERDAAALCYTSGTTGSPKGVLYSHRSTYLHAVTCALVDGFGLGTRDVVLPIVPMFHANAWGLPYGCFFAGADLVLPGRHAQPGPLLELLVERRVTFAAGVPSIWLGLQEPLEQARAKLSLDRILCGGSAVPPSLQEVYRDKVGVPMIQAWGMTETSPTATVCWPSRAPDAEEASRRHRLQGRPIPGVSVRIVDDAGVELPWDGTSVGELQARGNWVARAYFRDDAEDKFADGWLRTGDVAAIDPDGHVRITDRTKDLVKSGGEWISSVELEGAIMAHPGVAEAAVVAVAHPRFCERPLACVVLKPGVVLGRADVIAFLRDKVAKWWLPDDVVFIDAVPRTSVGKFDKKVLRERFKDHVLPG